jgi:hypothetical protein
MSEQDKAAWDREKDVFAGLLRVKMKGEDEATIQQAALAVMLTVTLPDRAYGCVRALAGIESRRRAAAVAEGADLVGAEVRMSEAMAELQRLAPGPWIACGDVVEDRLGVAIIRYAEAGHEPLVQIAKLVNACRGEP